MANKSNQVSASRIGQIKEVLKNAPEHELSQMVSGFQDSIRAIILAAHPQSLKKNKLQKKQLRSFVNSFISGLNASEILDLINRIEYYEDKLEECEPDIEEDYITSDDAYMYSLNKRIERLLLHGSLLPNTTDKNKFHEEMNALMKRLQSNVEKEAMRSGFSIGYVEADVLLDMIRSTGMDNYNISHGEEMNSYLSSINFTMALHKLYKIEEGSGSENFGFSEDLHDTIKFEIQCNRHGDEGASKPEMKYLFEKLGYRSDGDNFTFYENDHVEIKGYMYGSRYEGYENEEYTLEFYAKRKRGEITAVQFLELAMGKISFTVERVINEIYSEFGAPKQRYEFDIEILLKKMEARDLDDDIGEGGIAVESKNKGDSDNPYVSKNTMGAKKHYDIVLGDNQMEELKMLKDQFNNPEHYKNHGVDPLKGIVLYGPPGTGKTLFARKIANETDNEIIIVKPQDILNKWEGGNEKQIAQVFNKAKKKVSQGKKVIIFFDEADGLTKQRTNEKSNKEGMISIILQEMDGFDEKSLDNILVFFTTNRLDAIDDAIKRRFDKKIEIGLPNKKNRIKLFGLYIGKKLEKSKHNLFKDLDYELLAEKTKGKSGRFIKQLINNAVLSFAHSRIGNPRSKLITTQNIIDGIELIEKEEKKKKKIGY